MSKPNKKKSTPKTRLNAAMRVSLTALAERLLTCPAEASAADQAMNALSDEVVSHLDRVYPPKDMGVLAKYNAATLTSSVPVRRDDGDKVHHTIGDVSTKAFTTQETRIRRNSRGEIVETHIVVRDLTVEIPARFLPRGSQVPYAGTPEITALATDYLHLRFAHLEMLAEKRRDYESLIRGATYLEDVEAIWPEASEIRASLRTTALIPLSSDVLARIRADVAARQALRNETPSAEA